MKFVVVCGKNVKVEEESVGEDMVRKKVARASMAGCCSLGKAAQLLSLQSPVDVVVASLKNIKLIDKSEWIISQHTEVHKSIEA